MNDSDNTALNQEQKQDFSTNQSNNGFEVLSNDNSTSTDRKDEIEGDQQSLSRNEHSADQQGALLENKEETSNQEATGPEEHAQDSLVHNENLPQSQSDNTTQAHDGNITGNEQIPKEDTTAHQSQVSDVQNEQTHQDSTHQGDTPEQQAHFEEEGNKTHDHAGHDDATHQGSPTEVHNQQKSEIQKEKREIFVPNYVVDNQEEEEKKSPENNKSVQNFQQIANQHPQAFYQQLIQQQLAQQQAAGQQSQITAFPQQALQGAHPQQYFNPQFFNQQNPFSQMPFMPMQQPVFLPILDVCSEYQKGNFLPALHCLYYNLVAKDYVDSTGYNVLHHAVSYNNIDIVLVLLDHLKLDIHLKSKTNQSCVMIASNFGFNEMLKIILDRGGRLDEQDDTRFTALLYCIKQGHPSTFMYLISRGANYTLTDVNGCSVVHWAAYKNNVFLLRFFRRLGLEMNAVDLAGFTPLQRAISSEAVHAVKYLVEDLKIPVTAALQPDTIVNPSIKKIILKHLPGPKGFIEETKRDLYQIFEKSPQIFTYGFYLINLVIGFLCYSTGVVAMNELSFVYHIIFFVFSLYFAAYTYWYFLKSSESIIKLKTFAYQKLGVGLDSHNTSTIIDSSREMTVISPYKHDYLDNLISRSNFSLIDRKEDPDYPYPSFLHELYFNFEKRDWEKVAMFEEKKYCPTTLLLKKPKSKFCKETNTLVDGFNHYSFTLKRPVDKSIHPFYLLLLVQQTSLLFLYIFASVLTFYNDRTSSILMIIPETVYLQTIKTGLIVGLYLLITIIYLGYSSFFTLIELYCIMRNLTYNEFFNSHRYPYLYRPNPFASGTAQQFVKIFYNPYDKGVWKNICDYVSRVMH